METTPNAPTPEKGEGQEITEAVDKANCLRNASYAPHTSLEGKQLMLTEAILVCLIQLLKNDNRRLEREANQYNVPSGTTGKAKQRT
jgi:hypothetical protein